MEETKFDEIRPYRNHEIPEVIKRFLDTAPVEQLVHSVFPNMPVESFKAQMSQINTIKEFQSQIIRTVVRGILKQSESKFSYSGFENLSKDQAHLFISNHRDIVLDPALINLALFENDLETAEIAIGDNLLTENWIRDLVKINKSFIVKRNLPKRELILASRLLSEYIYEVVHTQGHPAWIAQREGRAKDGNDRTQPGLINMLSMASKGDFISHFQNLNIVPVSISYEYDPCDSDKIRSIYYKRFHGEYVKAYNEDSQSMKKGILGSKGHVHIHFGDPLNDEIGMLSAEAHRNEVIDSICAMIDRQVIMGYKLWKTNFIAYDLFNNITPDYQLYTRENRDQFIQEIALKAEALDGETDDLITLFYEVNARPVINQHALVDRPS